jgi:NAD(P)-dependent dehydrogenase (short-subunit alcohol dehydrogenase family)
MKHLFELNEHIILVTGGGNGIGQGVALGLAGLGARVIVWDVSREGLASTTDQARKAGHNIAGEHVDVTDEEAVRAGMDRIVGTHGRIDTVFINAGIAGRAKAIDEFTLGDWRSVHAVNLDGAFLTAREAARHMKVARRGKLVFTASVWGLRGARSAPVTAYMSSKGAIVNLTRQLALELAPYNINVNGIAPAGFLTTLGAGELAPSFGDWLMSRIPMNRMVEPSEMIGPAAFLASAASNWITGVTLPVDGGYLAE